MIYFPLEELRRDKTVTNMLIGNQQVIKKYLRARDSIIHFSKRLSV